MPEYRHWVTVRGRACMGTVSLLGVERARASKHPRQMSLDELQDLPVVDHLELHEISFVSPDRRIWDVGTLNGAWVKRLAPTSPPIEEI